MPVHRYVRTSLRKLYKDGGALGIDAASQAKMLVIRNQFAFSFMTDVVRRFLLSVQGRQAGGARYGDPATCAAQALAAIDASQLQRAIRLTRIGGSEDFEVKAMSIETWFEYTEFAYLADRVIDDWYLSVAQDVSPDAHPLDFIINNKRRTEQIIEAGGIWKKQMILAREGHPRFLFRLKMNAPAPSGAAPAPAPASAGGSGRSAGKRPAPPSAATGQRGERRGLSDLDEEDKVS